MTSVTDSGISGRVLLSGGGASRRTAAMMSACVSPPNGRDPARSS